jgi:class 3 adenylate cyclase/tetratricopeptide (TPR) repeat protein
MRDLAAPYVPIDRRLSPSTLADLPDRCVGTALFADLSGFTRLTARLVDELGPDRGAEALGTRLELIYTALVHEVHRYRGAVIGFSGDAITCWFDGDDGLRAVTAAHEMQRAIATVGAVTLPRGETLQVALKVAVVRGPARRFLVGDPDIQAIDVLAGSTLDRLAQLERLATPGDVLVDEGLAALDGLSVAAREADDDAVAYLVGGLAAPAPEAPWPRVEVGEDAASWVLPAVRQRLEAGAEAFLAGFRPAAALFLSFGGIDFDGDDEAGRSLDTFIRRVQRVVQDLDGALIQLTIGDKGCYLFSAFGAPVATGEESDQALSAALELISAAAPPVRDVRIGVAHGQMYAGAYGSHARRTFGVLGPKTNLAARLMTTATVGQILCDQAVARHASARFAFTPLPPVRLKGITEPVPVFEPTLQTQTPAQTAGERAVLVGREDELVALRARARAALQGATTVTLVEGDAGVGKSALLRALEADVGALGMRLLQGAASSGGRGRPYLAWRRVLDQLLELPAGSDEGTRAAAAMRTTQRLARGWTDRLAVLNDALDLGVPESDLTRDMDPDLRRDNLRQLVVALVSGAAHERPLVLTLDEGQSLDSMSWELAAELARSLVRNEVPAAVVIALRPLYGGPVGQSQVQTLLELPGSERFELGPLDEGAVVGLTAGVLGVAPPDVPEELARLVAERAGGNPLFVEALVRSLVDAGLLSVTGSGAARVVRYTVDAATRRDVVPDSLHALVLARVDRLLPAAQLTIKAATVVGQEVDFDPLRAAVSDVGESAAAALPEHLAALLARRLLELDDESAARYRFQSEITHAAVYASLLFAQRRRLHRVLADWYQRHLDEGDERDAFFAHHGIHALHEDDAPETVEATLAVVERTGKRLARLGAHVEAATLYRVAIAALPDRPEWRRQRIGLLLALGASQESVGDYTAATASFEEAHARAFREDDPEREAAALSGLCMVALRTGDAEGAAVLGAQALERATVSAAPAQVARANSNLGIAAFYKGDLEEADRHFSAALQHYRAVGDQDGQASAINSLGVAAMYREQFDRADQLLHEGLALAEASQDALNTGRFLSNLGILAQDRGDLDLAIERYQQALDLLRALGARQQILLTTMCLGDGLAAKHDAAAARRCYAEAVAGAQEVGAVPVALNALRGTALCLHLDGHDEEAARLLGHVLQHPAVNMEIRQQGDALRADLAARLGEDAVRVAMEEGATWPFDEVASRYQALR